MLERISLKTMIVAGFTCTLVLLVLLAAVALRGNAIIGADFTDYRQAAREGLLMNEANAALLETRLAVTQFRMTHDMARADAVRASLDSLDGIKAQADSIITEPAVIERLEQLRAGVGHYRAAFEEMMQVHQEMAVLTPEISNEGRAARSAISEIMQSAYADNDAEAAYLGGVLQQNIMLARLYADRYLATSSPDHLERVSLERERVLEAGATLLRALQNPARRSLHRQFIDHFNRFSSSFDDAAALLQQMNAIKNERLNILGPQVMAGYTSLLRAATDTQNTLGPKAASEIASVSRTTVILTIVALAIGALAAYLIGRTITKALSAAVGRMSALAEGSLDIEIEGDARADELGDMARALRIFQTNGHEKVRLETEQAAQAERAEEEKRASMNALADGFEASVNEVVAAVSAAAEQMLGLAQAMSEAADRANHRSSAVSAASEEASTNVETVAAASEEMTNSIAEVSERISQSATMTDDAARGAERATSTVSQLSTSAQTIGDVVRLISDIAEQTNLLALNATIEAARAGEAGKGFAVVASEVKSLANQTAKATEQISNQVNGMQGDTNAVVDAISSIGSMISELNTTASSIAAAVEEQHSATQEIARNTQQAADGTREVSSNITEVSTAVMETGEAAREVLSASSQLAGDAERLRDRMRAFLEQVRAA
ncbi:MAG: HAMP domain-containing methyl-accepting chemotaxis protein [Pseudomonadota bacterium]